MPESRRQNEAPAYELSDHGFKHYAPIATTYGHEVKVYESSAAVMPFVWLAIDERAAHLTFEQAQAVIATLEAAMANHYQEVEP